MPLWAPRTRRTKGGSARVAQAHRIPGGLLLHCPAGPALVATGCSDARGPPDGLAAGVDHLRHLGQRRGALRPVVADLGAVVARLPGVRPRPDRGVRPEPRGHVLALGPPRPGRGGSWASVAYRPDQAWRSSRLLENLAISRQLTSSDGPWGTLAGGRFDAPLSNAAR